MQPVTVSRWKQTISEFLRKETTSKFLIVFSTIYTHSNFITAWSVQIRSYFWSIFSWYGDWLSKFPYSVRIFILDGKPTPYGLQHRKWRNTYYQFQEKGRGNCLNLWKRKVKSCQNYYSRWTRVFRTISRQGQRSASLK